VAAARAWGVPLRALARRLPGGFAHALTRRYGSWAAIPAAPPPGPIQCRLRELRQARGLSLAALAAAVGVSPTPIRAYERGAWSPSLAMALRIARALAAPVDAVWHLADDGP
jgi:DNA-binding XRE family transcriptional regulator